VEGGVAAPGGGVAPAYWLSIIIGEKSTNPVFLDEFSSHLSGLGLVSVCKVVEGAVAVAPVRIVGEGDLPKK
jgi:hypothetical protein